MRRMVEGFSLRLHSGSRLVYISIPMFGLRTLGMNDVEWYIVLKPNKVNTKFFLSRIW
jgi:hypothetical protein